MNGEVAKARECHARAAVILADSEEVEQLLLRDLRRVARRTMLKTGT